MFLGSRLSSRKSGEEKEVFGKDERSAGGEAGRLRELEGGSEWY